VSDTARDVPASPVTLDLDWYDPLTAFAAVEHEPYALLLHDGRSGRARLFAGPGMTMEGRTRADFDRFAEAFRASGPTGLWAGLLGYDLARAFEVLPETRGEGRGLHMAHYAAWAEFDRQAGRLRIHAASDAAARSFAARLGRDSLAEPEASPVAEWQARWTPHTYLEAARTARDYVHAGDVFQVNLSQAFDATLAEGDTPWQVFRRLCENSPAPHAAYFRLNADEVILTNSPERFLAVEAGRVEARPIKGTRRRDADAVRDAALRAELSASVKDRAENLMIVDLMRNDLARVCEPASVRVPALCEVETYANVHHLVSVVTGQLRVGQDLPGLIAASFPPGSITGAPKVRAMEIITELEGDARGAYCGTLGWMSPAGALDLNVMIRTASFRHSAGRWQGEIRSGGGIVADSDPQAEYEETLTKASALRRAVGGGA